MPPASSPGLLATKPANHSPPFCRQKKDNIFQIGSIFICNRPPDVHNLLWYFRDCTIYSAGVRSACHERASSMSTPCSAVAFQGKELCSSCLYRFIHELINGRHRTTNRKKTPVGQLQQWYFNDPSTLGGPNNRVSGNRLFACWVLVGVAAVSLGTGQGRRVVGRRQACENKS